MVYQFKPARRIRGDANIIGAELRRIETERGTLRPADVVTEAKPEASLLHPHFEWDNELAAEAHRENQARYLIRSIVLVDDSGEDEHQVRAFVNVNMSALESEDDSGQAYINVQKALGTPVLREQVITKALKEIEWWEKRYRELAEFAPVLMVLSQLRQELAVAS